MRPYLFLIITAIIISASCKKTSLSQVNMRQYRLTDSSYTYSWKGTGYTNTATISTTISLTIDTANYVLWGSDTFQKLYSGYYQHSVSEVQKDISLTDSSINIDIIGPASPGSAYYGISMRGVRE